MCTYLLTGCLCLRPDQESEVKMWVHSGCVECGTSSLLERDLRSGGADGSGMTARCHVLACRVVSLVRPMRSPCPEGWPGPEPALLLGRGGMLGGCGRAGGGGIHGPRHGQGPSVLAF